MRTISKSVVDPRNLSFVLIGIGGTPLVLGIISLNWILILSGIGILAVGILVLFFGKSTYKVNYDNRSEEFTLSSRQDNLIVSKKDVLSVKGRFTISQIWWPFPRLYFYVLTVKNELGKKKRYRFVIWSNQPNLKSNYEMLERSVASWNKRN